MKPEKIVSGALNLQGIPLPALHEHPIPYGTRTVAAFRITWGDPVLRPRFYEKEKP